MSIHQLPASLQQINTAGDDQWLDYRNPGKQQDKNNNHCHPDPVWLKVHQNPPDQFPVGILAVILFLIKTGKETHMLPVYSLKIRR